LKIIELIKNNNTILIILVKLLAIKKEPKMKKLFLLTLLGLFFSLLVIGQTEAVPGTAQDSVLTKTSELPKNYDITLGYAPRLPFNALKSSFSINNIFWKRMGFYASLEKGLDTNYFAGTLGITSYINKSIYLWGGIGIFPYNDSKNSSFWSRFRKEFGVGINPYKLTVIRLGWSFTVGPTAAIGFRIPINANQKNRKSRN
jgi:hypothetical protein